MHIKWRSLSETDVFTRPVRKVISHGGLNLDRQICCSFLPIIEHQGSLQPLRLCNVLLTMYLQASDRHVEKNLPACPACHI